MKPFGRGPNEAFDWKPKTGQTDQHPLKENMCGSGDDNSKKLPCTELENRNNRTSVLNFLTKMQYANANAKQYPYPFIGTVWCCAV